MVLALKKDNERSEMVSEKRAQANTVRPVGYSLQRRGAQRTRMEAGGPEVGGEEPVGG